MKIISPDNKYRILWEFFVLLITILATILSPLIVVFNMPLKGLILAMDIFITFVFATDIFLNFNTGYEKRRKMITDRKKLTKRYLKGWFIPDLLATIPFSLIFFSVHGLIITRMFRFFRLTRLFKLLSANKTLRKSSELSNKINPSFIRMILLIFWILIFAHMVAIIWVAMVGVNPDIPIKDQYLKALYWTITTITTIGYGDISPLSLGITAVPANVITTFTIIIELLGAGMYGFIIGNISNLIANLDVAKSQHQEKVERINTFLKYKNLPGNIQKRVNNYYDYLWESRRGYNEAQVIKELPISLKEIVSLQINKEIMEKVPLFKGASQTFLKEVILNLEPVVFTPEYYIIRGGEIGYEMYFISRGSVTVLSADENITYATLNEGQFFGEMALLLSMPRTATVKASDYCDLYLLHKDTFNSILLKYPSFAKKIEELADKRRAENETKIQESQEEKLQEHKIEEAELEEIGDNEPQNPPMDYPDLLKVPQRISQLQISVLDDDNYLKLRWKSIKNTYHYQILKKIPHSDKWKLLNPRILTPEYLDMHPVMDDKNIYRIRGVNQNGSGEWSSPFLFSLDSVDFPGNDKE
jgi:CRP-like cAMP-binding protein